MTSIRKMRKGFFKEAAFEMGPLLRSACNGTTLRRGQTETADHMGDAESLVRM